MSASSQHADGGEQVSMPHPHDKGKGIPIPDDYTKLGEVPSPDPNVVDVTLRSKPRPAGKETWQPEKAPPSLLASMPLLIWTTRFADR